MNWDSDGRLWIASSNTYPQVNPEDVAASLEAQIAKAKKDAPSAGNDKIIIVEDPGHTGKAVKSTVFAEGLLIPTGVAPFQDAQGHWGCYVGAEHRNWCSSWTPRARARRIDGGSSFRALGRKTPITSCIRSAGGPTVGSISINRSTSIPTSKLPGAWCGSIPAASFPGIHARNGSKCTTKASAIPGGTPGTSGARNSSPTAREAFRA